MTLELTGIHHLTAITARASENFQFYTETLGLRLVKKTVNQDDTSAYHLFYADGQASPGSDITFFDWPARQEARGTHAIIRTGLRVSGDGALGWWHDRLSRSGAVVGKPVQRVGRTSLDFEDPEGQRLMLVDDRGAGEAHPWARSSVEPERQLRGLGPIMLSVPRLDATARVLTGGLNMRKVDEYGDAEVPQARVHVFAMGAGGPAAELHVAVEPDARAAVQGAGGAHHVAFRTPDTAQLTAWTERLTAFGLKTSGEVERYYFRSLYFREPGGILFEIATDTPGFAVDEPLDRLGEALSLPPFLEPRRTEIEAKLKPI